MTVGFWAAKDCFSTTTAPSPFSSKAVSAAAGLAGCS